MTTTKNPRPPGRDPTGGLTIARYEGTRVSDFDLENAKSEPFSAILVTGALSDCEGCSEERMLYFFNGDWLCINCLKDSVEECEYEEREEPPERL